MTRDGDGPQAWLGRRAEARLNGGGLHAVGKVISYCEAPTVVIETDDGERVSWRADMIEVLGPVDDPSKDLVGTIRRSDAGVPVALTADDGDWPWSGFGAHYTSHSHDEVVGWPVTDAVPGTPAAEARDKANASEPARLGVRVENTPHGPSPQDRAKIANHLADGDVNTAVVVARNAGVADPRSYVQDMSERPSVRYFKNQYGQRFRAKADGTTQVLMGATWCPSNRKLASLLDDQYMREVDESEALS